MGTSLVRNVINSNEIIVFGGVSFSVLVLNSSVLTTNFFNIRVVPKILFNKSSPIEFLKTKKMNAHNAKPIRKTI